MTLHVKNWESFQHYKDRNPPWIKLYRTLLNDRNFFNLSGDCVKTLILLWIIAADTPTGELPSIPDLAFKIRIDENQLRQQLVELKHWIIFDASDLLAGCLQDDSNLLHRDREETKKRREENNKDKPAEPTTKTKTIAEKYIDSINAITGRKGNPIKTILPEVERRLRQGIEPWKIIAAPLILKASTIHPGLWKRENIYSILLRDGSKPVRGINGGPSQPGVDWINSAIEAIDTVHFDAQKVAIAIDLEVWRELKDKIKSFEEPNYAE